MSMSTFRRLFTGASLTALLAGAFLAPAHAGSEFCAHDSSTRVFTANDGTYKLWVDTATVGGYQETHVCFAVGTALAGDYAFRDGLSGTFTPTVTPTVDDPNCPRLLHIQDPVDVMTELGSQLSGNPYVLCVGVTDQAFRVTLGTPSPSADPDVHLYLDRNTTAGDQFCAVAQNNPGCTGSQISIDIV